MTEAPKADATQEITQGVARRAVEWMFELQSGHETPALRQEWTEWRDAHPMHELAWQRVERVRNRLDGLSGASVVAHATLGAAAQQRRHTIKGLTLLLFGGGIAYTLQDRTPWREWTADHRTLPGEQGRITLPDGTLLVLDTDTAINVKFDLGERRLVLLHGEVFVDTAKDPTRRFLVEVPHGLAEALGTQFTVRSSADRAVVAVFQGAVHVTPGVAGAQSQILEAGQGAAFTGHSVEAPSPVGDADKAWVDGTLVAKSMRLADLLAKLSRYSPHPIGCDASVADLRVSGSYPVTEIPLILEALSASLHLQVETVTRFWGRQVVSVRLTPRAEQPSKNAAG